MNGLYFSITQKRSYFVETRKEWVGFGVERYEQDKEVFLGYLQITVSESREGKPQPRVSVRRRTAALALCAALAFPTVEALAALQGWWQQFGEGFTYAMENNG